MTQAPSEGRALLERARWPAGPACPKCGSSRITRLSTRPHWFTCCGCRKSQFSATSGTPLHRTRLSDEQILTAWRLLKVRRRSLTPMRLCHILDCSYLTARKLLDRFVLIDVDMPAFGRRLREEVARDDAAKEAGAA